MGKNSRAKAKQREAEALKKKQEAEAEALKRKQEATAEQERQRGFKAFKECLEKDVLHMTDSEFFHSFAGDSPNNLQKLMSR